MEPPQTLYNQAATHFVLRHFLEPDSHVEGQLVVELATIFLSDLVFPGCVVTSLETKRPGEGARLNMGEFSERRWNAAVKKILAGECAVLGLKAQTPDFPNQKIWFTVHGNPPGGDELLVAGTIEVSCSVSYLRHLVASPDKVEALLKLGTTAWNGIEGGPAYGFGNLAIVPQRERFGSSWAARPPGAPLPWESIKVPDQPAHAIPVASVGADIDGNLQQLYVKDRGIKGAFWANYLSAVHVRMAGGDERLCAALAGMRVEPLNAGGLLVVATDSPLPPDSEENRERFLRLYEALRPAFLSRAELPEAMRKYVGYFYREHPPLDVRGA
jgi:hypothetical protein